jgi:hypothetical protein
MKQAVSNSKIRQNMEATDAHYHTGKLGLGGHGTHEGWIHAEEVEMHEKDRAKSASRHEKIAVAAYYLAEKRGFVGNESLHDWIEAEAEIDVTAH